MCVCVCLSIYLYHSREFQRYDQIKSFQDPSPYSVESTVFKRFIHMYIVTNTHARAHTKTDRQRDIDRETETVTDRQIGRQTDTGTETERAIYGKTAWAKN